MTSIEWSMAQLASIDREKLFVAVFGLAGIVLGAWLTSRRDTTRRVLEEITAIRAARALCFAIINRLFTLKEQMILPLHRDYYMEREGLAAAREAATAGSTKTIQARMDLQLLSPFGTPMQLLERLVFDRMSCPSTGLLAAAEFVSTMDAFSKSVEYRNVLVIDFQRRGAELGDADRVLTYFGLPRAGFVDQRIEMNVNALYRQLDDCIFFGQMLDEQLLAHGRRLRHRHLWRYRLATPKFVEADWSLAAQKGLVPSRARYPSLVSAFRSKPSMLRRIVTKDPGKPQKKAGSARR